MEKFVKILVVSLFLFSCSKKKADETTTTPPTTDAAKSIATAIANAGSLGAVTTAGGFLYAVDSTNHVIKKIDPTTGSVSIFAGGDGVAGSADGVGTAARFNGPSGITTDGTNLYVTDRFNHTIRAIVISTQTVSLLAGVSGLSGYVDSGSPKFTQPIGIDYAYGQLYVADSGNHAIRRIEATINGGYAPGYTITIAGTGNQGSTDGFGTTTILNTPQTVLVNGIYLYIFEGMNHVVRKINMINKEATKVAGAQGVLGTADGTLLAAELGDISSMIAIDANTILAVDSYSNTIRKIDLTLNTVTTIAGVTGAAGSDDGVATAAKFSSPTGMVSLNGTTYITDTGNLSLRSYK